MFFHRVVEFFAVVRRVIEPAQLAEGIIAIILEAGLSRDLLAQADLAVENIVELVRLLKPALRHEFPRLLPQRAVGFFEVAAHLHQRLFLAAKINRERAGQFLVLLGEFGFLGFERDIFGAKQIDVVLHVAVEDCVARLEFKL